MKTKHLSRRQLLGGSVLLGAGSAAFGGLAPMMRLARAGTPDGPSDRYYIFCYFAGGWDILISLDPRNPREFTEANVSETMIFPAYHLMDNEGHKDRPFWATPNMYIGPYMGDLAQHASKFSIVRGMSMETLSHQAGMRRFLTGKAPSGLLARGSSYHHMTK